MIKCHYIPEKRVIECVDACLGMPDIDVMRRFAINGALSYAHSYGMRVTGNGDWLCYGEQDIEDDPDIIHALDMLISLGIWEKHPDKYMFRPVKGDSNDS